MSWLTSIINFLIFDIDIFIIITVIGSDMVLAWFVWNICWIVKLKIFQNILARFDFDFIRACSRTKVHTLLTGLVHFAFSRAFVRIIVFFILTIWEVNFFITPTGFIVWARTSFFPKTSKTLCLFSVWVDWLYIISKPKPARRVYGYF